MVKTWPELKGFSWPPTIGDRKVTSNHLDVVCFLEFFFKHLIQQLQNLRCFYSPNNKIAWTPGLLSIIYIHPGKLLWKLKITQLKRKLIFQTIIFRFHVNIPRCTHEKKNVAWKNQLSLRLFPKGACEFLLICVAILVASTCGLEGFKGANGRDQGGGRIGSQGKSTSDMTWWRKLK